jgi:hypothetical protein
VEVDNGSNAGNAVWKQPIAVPRQLSASTWIAPDSVEHIVQSVHASLGAVRNVLRVATVQVESPMATSTQIVVVASQVKSKQAQSSPAP